MSTVLKIELLGTGLEYGFVGVHLGAESGK